MNADQRPGSSPASTRRVLLRLLAYLRPYMKAQILCLVFLLAGTAGSLAIPLLVREMLDTALPARDLPLLLRLVAAMAAFHLVSSLCLFATDVTFLKVSNGVLLDLRRDMHRHLMKQSLGFFASTKTGQIVARIMGDVDAVQVLTTNAFLMLLADSFAVLLMFAFMLQVSGGLTLIAAGTLAILMLVLRLFNRRVLRTARSQREAYGQVSEELAEGIAGAREIRVFGAERGREASFLDRLVVFAGVSFRTGLWGSVGRLASLLVVSLGPVLAYGFGGVEAIQGSLTVGTLVAFVAYLSRTYEPVQRLAILNVQVQSAMGAVERIFAFLDTAPAVSEDPRPAATGPARGSLEIEGVVFRYPENGSSPSLGGIDLRVRPGETVALVGPSGAGKSTLAGLILRLFDPQAGTVRLDGVDIRRMALADLRKAIALVPQDTFLFHASVAENLRLAKPDATPEELRRAAALADAAEFIEALPEGYDTIVGERGVKLSGGQKQRLSIARAILRNPRVIVFDEATSSLDPRSEGMVRASMGRLMAGRTTIIISHRPATVAAADRIVVLDAGRIVEEGAHDSLLRNGGLYARLYAEQSASAAVLVPA